MPGYAIGTTSGNLVYLANASPKMLPDPYPVESNNLRFKEVAGEDWDSVPIEVGPGFVIWKWGKPGLQQVQWNWLIGYCSGASANVYIRTRIESGSSLSFAVFSAVMQRPKADLAPGPLYVNVEVKFSNLVAV